MKQPEGTQRRTHPDTEGNSKMQTPPGELQEVVAAINELENDYMFVYICNNSYDVSEVKFIYLFRGNKTIGS
jgi:hypothetical protein